MKPDNSELKILSEKALQLEQLWKYLNPICYVVKQLLLTDGSGSKVAGIFTSSKFKDLSSRYDIM